MIDWERVRELRDEIGAADFAEVAQLFLEETDAVVKNIKKDTTPQAVEAALHFLKGSALNLGFSKLAAICQIGEKAAACGQSDGIDLGVVVTVYEQSKTAFAAGRQAKDAA